MCWTLLKKSECHPPCRITPILWQLQCRTEVSDWSRRISLIWAVGRRSNSPSVPLVSNFMVSQAGTETRCRKWLVVENRPMRSFFSTPAPNSSPLRHPALTPHPWIQIRCWWERTALLLRYQLWSSISPRQIFQMQARRAFRIRLLLRIPISESASIFEILLANRKILYLLFDFLRIWVEIHKI